MGSGDVPKWSVFTWGSWRAAEVWDGGFITIKYDTFGDSHYDYYALIRSNGARLLGTLHRDYARKQDRKVRNLRVGRPSRASARITVPYGSMRFSEPRVFRWVVNTTWGDPRCGEATCIDRAPDRGAVDEPRGPVPTPTLTITPTPEPTESER
jgi:hypothetical protein